MWPFTRRFRKERRRNFGLRRMVDLTHSTAPAGMVDVTEDGIWVTFSEAGNLRIYPPLETIEASRTDVLDKARELAEVYEQEGYGTYEVSVKER